MKSVTCDALERERNPRTVTNAEFATIDLQLMNIYELKILEARPVRFV